jgi:hypothetical protein
VSLIREQDQKHEHARGKGLRDCAAAYLAEHLTHPPPMKMADYPYYGYGYNYLDGSGLAAAATAPVAVAAATTAPLITGRSVAIGNVQMGNYCTTPVRTCLLINESWVGNGCSCHIRGGRARGSVTQ